MTMDRFLVPEPLKDDNLGESWVRFRRAFEQFLIVKEHDHADGKVKVALLLKVIGARGNDIYENFAFAFEILKVILCAEF